MLAWVLALPVAQAGQTADQMADLMAVPPPVHLTQAEVVQQLLPHDQPPPRQVDSRQLPQAWQPVSLPHAQPHAIVAQASAALSGPQAMAVTWYRLKVPDAAWAPQPLMLYGARAKGYGPVSVYVDGQLVGQWQLDGVQWYWAPFWLTVDGGQRSVTPREVLVRMAHPAHTRTALASVWLGHPDSIRWRYMARQWLQLQVPAMGGGAFLAVGLFAFFVWLRSLRDITFLLFSVLAVSSFIRGLHYYVDFEVRDDLLGWLTVNSLFWLIGAVHHLQMRLHQRTMPRLTRVLHLIIGTVFVVSLPVLHHLPNTPDFSPLVYVLAMVTSPLVAYAGFRLSWRRSIDGMLVASAVITGTLFGFNDWAIQNNLLGAESWYLGPYANILNFALFCTIMFRHYMRAVDGVRESNVVLGHKLAEREAELHHSYERLRAVERQQTLQTERQRMMQDMHDGLGSALHSALRAVEHGRLAEHDVVDVLRGCIDDLHLAIDSMDPAHADLQLLMATLRHRLGPRLKQAGLTLDWHVHDLPELQGLDPRNALHIMRIVQEALTNSLKHSGADRLTLVSEVTPHDVRIRIRDNGRGFQVQPDPAAGGRGLQNQQRRAQAIGARVSWQSGPAGTETLLCIPLIPGPRPDVHTP
jgi:signal transduction histidine kinase